MQKLEKVNIQSDFRKRKPFNLSHVSTTSFGIGYIEPISGIEIPVGNTHININPTANAVIRLDPLSRPTFGRLVYKTWTQFVPYKDIWQNFDNFLAQKEVSTSHAVVRPRYVPHFDGAFAMFLLIALGSDNSQTRMKAEIFKRAGLNDTNKNFVQQDTNQAALYDSCCPQLCKNTCNEFKTFLGSLGTNFDWRKSNHADHWAPDMGDIQAFTNDGTDDYLITFKLTPVQRRLMKIFNVLGIKPTFHVTSHRYNLLSFLAYRKAQFDLFSLAQFDDWETNPAYRCMRDLSDSYGTVAILSTVPAIWNTLVLPTYVRDLLTATKEMASCYYPEDKNFVSSHVDLSQYGLEAKTRYFDTHFDTAQAQNSPVQSMFGFVRGAYTESGAIDENILRIMKQLYYTCNRQEQIGSDLGETLKVLGYGEYVDSCKSTFIGATSQLLEVSEVDNAIDISSTSPTGGTPRALGEAAGKSVTYDEGRSFDYEANEIGCIIVLGAIVPESGFVAQTNPLSSSVYHDEFYSPEFDAVGWEASPRSAVGSFTACEIPNGSVQSDDIFGYLPRYTKHKVHGDILNGDFALGSQREDNADYHFERMITDNTFVCTATNTAGIYTSDLKTNMDASRYFPNAGKDWRYPTKFRWLGNFDRVFTDGGVFGDVHFGEDYFYTYDHIKAHIPVLVSLDSPMKPIADSWDTFDDDETKNGNSVTVRD